MNKLDELLKKDWKIMIWNNSYSITKDFGGIYIIFDEKYRPFYIGQSKAISCRLRQHPVIKFLNQKRTVILFLIINGNSWKTESRRKRIEQELIEIIKPIANVDYLRKRVSYKVLRRLKKEGKLVLHSLTTNNYKYWGISKKVFEKQLREILNIQENKNVQRN